MSSRATRIGLAAVATAMLSMASVPTRGVAAESDRVLPDKEEQTGMSWVEYFRCVVTVQDQIGSWSYAAQECSIMIPNDPPDVPVRSSSPTREAPRR